MPVELFLQRWMDKPQRARRGLSRFHGGPGSGQASVGRDTERARSLWNEQQQVWWPGGPSDPNVLVIQFSPKRAEIWDGPASSAVAACEFAKARATRRKPNLGEKRKSMVKLN